MTSVLERPGVLPINIHPATGQATLALDWIDADDANERPGLDAGVAALLAAWDTLDHNDRMVTIRDLGLLELITSIQAAGLQEPLRIYPQPNGRAGLSSGHRRFYSLRILQKMTDDAQWNTAPVVVEPAPANDAERAIRRIVANMARADIDPISFGEGVQALVDQHGYSQNAVGRLFGKSQETISNLGRLRTLPAEIQAHIRAGRLGHGHGLALLRIKTGEYFYWNNQTGKTPTEIQLGLAQQAVDRGQSVRVLTDTADMTERTNASAKRIWDERQQRAVADAAAIATARDAGRDLEAEGRAARLAEEQRLKDNEARTRQLRKVGRDAIAKAVAWDEAEAPPLAHLQFAALLLIDSHVPTDRREKVAAEITAGDWLTVERWIVRLALGRLELNYGHTGLDTYSDPIALNWANRTFGLNAAIEAAQQAAGLREAQAHSAGEPADEEEGNEIDEALLDWVGEIEAILGQDIEIAALFDSEDAMFAACAAAGARAQPAWDAAFHFLSTWRFAHAGQPPRPDGFDAVVAARLAAMEEEATELGDPEEPAPALLSRLTEQTDAYIEQLGAYLTQPIPSTATTLDLRRLAGAGVNWQVPADTLAGFLEQTDLPCDNCASPLTGWEYLGLCPYCQRIPPLSVFATLSLRKEAAAA
jgi:ParB family chromosome partitioning protein